MSWPQGILDEFTKVYEKIYATDLVYVKDCYKLCGGGDCCTRQPKFRFMLRKQATRLPLLPGEYEFLKSKGLERRLPVSHDVVTMAIDERYFRVEQLIGETANCFCEHNTRLTTCRLFPLLPQYEIDGRVVGATTGYAIHDQLMELNAEPRICAVNSLNFEQFPLFFEIATALGSHPVLLFYLMAYQHAMDHVITRQKAWMTETPNADAWQLYENHLIRKKLADVDVLKAELCALADAFEERYGNRFWLPRENDDSNLAD